MRTLRQYFFSLLWLLPALVAAQAPHTVTIAPAPGYTGTPYQVSTIRDLSVYPLTTEGYTRFSKAIARGMLNLTVQGTGCVIRAGTVPPLVAPNCTPTTTPGGGTVVTPIVYNRVVMVGNSLMYHPADGDRLGWYGNNGMAATAPEKDWFHITEAYLKTLNPSVECKMWGRFQGTSDAEGGYYEKNYWRIENGMERYNAIADWMPDLIILRISENIDDLTHNLYGNLGALIDKMRSKNPNCRVVVTNSVWGQVDVSEVFKSFATARNYPFADLLDMSGQTQYYAGTNDGSQPDRLGATWFTNPSVAKHTNDLGMAEMARRIIAKIPTSVTTTTGGGTTSPPAGNATLAGLPTFETFGYQVPASGSTNWTGMDNRTNLDGVVGEYVSLSNGQVNVRVHKRQGGTPSHISGPDGRNLINLHDLGTQNGQTLYRGGAISDKANPKISKQWKDIPNDPIQMGSVFGDPSQVVDMRQNPNEIYTKTIMNNWPVENDPTDAVLEQWVKLDGPAVHVYTKVAFNRVADKTLHEAFTQEYPTFYTVLKNRTLAYVGASGGLQYTTGQAGQFDIGLQKNWVALAESASPSSPAIGLGAPGMYLSTQWQKSLQEGGDDLANGAGYSAWRAFIMADWNGVWYSHHYFVVGTVSEIKAYCEAQPDPRNTIKWKFNTRNGRGHWHHKNGVDPGFPALNDGIEITKKAGGEFFIMAPYLAIPASTVSSIFIRYKASGFSSPWILNYNKTGQQDGDAISAGQQIGFSTINDDQWHVLQIPTAWSGIISKLRLSNDGAAAGSKIKIDWINTANSDPEP